MIKIETETFPQSSAIDRWLGAEGLSDWRQDLPDSIGLVTLIGSVDGWTYPLQWLVIETC